MGRGSATRNVAAVTIQRWLRRRFELTRAIRLLGILHILREEVGDAGVVAPLLQGAVTTSISSLSDSTAVTVMTGGGDKELDTAQRVVDSLIDVAVMYAKQLHAENFKRHVGVDSREAHDAAPRRVSLLPDTTLTRLLAQARAERSARRCRQTAQHLQASLGASNVMWLLRFVSGAHPMEEVKKTRLLLWCLWRVLSNVSALLSQDAAHSLDNAPPHSQSLFLQRVISRAVGKTAEEGENREKKQVGPQAPCDGGGNEDKVISDDDSTDSDADDAYDDTYYNRREERLQARVARLKSLLKIHDTSAGASKSDGLSEAVAYESYVHRFGEVKDVLFPTLNAMRKVTSGSCTTNNVCCCVVCELGGEAAEFVVCRCGNSLHADCATDAVNGVPRCSQFCHSS